MLEVEIFVKVVFLVGLKEFYFLGNVWVDVPSKLLAVVLKTDPREHPLVEEAFVSH